MRLGSMDEGWSGYRWQWDKLTPPRPDPPAMPPAAIMVLEAGTFVAGCCIYPATMGTLLATGIRLSDYVGSGSGWPTRQAALTFLFKALRGHATVANQAALIDLTGLDMGGLVLPIEPAELWTLNGGTTPEPAVESPKTGPKKRPAKKKRKAKKKEVKGDSGEKA